MHEIITLQFGQQANYVGTHYWNTQESYFTYAGQDESPVDHDISFRAGIGADGSDTYTPRALIYDLKGAFGTLRRDNALYELQQQEAPTQQSQWSGRTLSLQLPPIAPSAYQQALDQGAEPPQLSTSTVRFWSDYNHIFYHPRSIVQLNEYELNSSLMPFERWHTGEELFANLDREHDLLDRDLRPLLEECDQLQAIQIFAGIDDAWGGFTARYLERISDELGKGCRWVFGLQDGRQNTRERQMLQLGNLAQSVYSLDTAASVHIPITSVPPSLPSYVSLNTSSPWHTAALEAVTIESITLPTRLRSSGTGRATFDQLETALNNDGNRRLIAPGLSVGDPADVQVEANQGGIRDTRMTNGITDGHDQKDTTFDIDQFLNLRNSSNARGTRLGRHLHTFSRTETLRGPWKSAEEIDDANASSRDPFTSGPRVTAYQSELLFPLLSSCPQIFRFEGRAEKVAVKAASSASTAVADRVCELESLARRMVTMDEREALCDGLSRMAEEYKEAWSGSDDSDDDD